jgi:hypothetical protein
MPAMTTITIVAETPGSATTNYRALAGRLQSVGQTPGQALDALAAQLGDTDNGTLIVVQQGGPDCFFTAQQQQRLADLMARWQTARDTGTPLPGTEQAELEALVDAEVRAAGQRATALAKGLAP